MLQVTTTKLEAARKQFPSLDWVQNSWEYSPTKLVCNAFFVLSLARPALTNWSNFKYYFTIVVSILQKQDFFQNILIDAKAALDRFSFCKGGKRKWGIHHHIVANFIYCKLSCASSWNEKTLGITIWRSSKDDDKEAAGGWTSIEASFSTLFNLQRTTMLFDKSISNHY